MEIGKLKVVVKKENFEIKNSTQIRLKKLESSPRTLVEAADVPFRENQYFLHIIIHYLKRKVLDVRKRKKSCFRGGNFGVKF